MPVHRRTAAAWLAEIDITGQFTDDQDVQPRHQFRLQRRRVRQLRVAQRRPQVGEQTQVLAQTQDGLLWPQRAFELVELPVAHGAEEDGVCGPGQVQRAIRQRVAMGLEGCAAHQGRFGFGLQFQRVQHLDRFGHDLGTDAVARQDGNFHVLWVLRRCFAWPAKACVPGARPRRL
jgi:hypothetical protein